MKARNLSDVKMANKSILYDCIRRNDGVSISDLEYMTQLSRPTVTNLIRTMENEGMILCTGQTSSRGGRAAALYSPNANAFFAIGIDFEFPMVNIAITNLEYTCIVERSFSLDENASCTEIIEALLHAIDVVIEESKIPHDRFLGICMGIPGQTDLERKHSTIERIPGWHDIHIGDLLTAHLDMPAYIENDANMLAWAEYRKDVNNATSNRLFIILRHGIGMGVIMNGRLLEGSRGNAGRIGHVSVNADGPLCVCGNRGCLSLYASEHAIVKRYQEVSGVPLSSLREVSQLAKQNDQNAIEVMSVAGRYLGNMILSLTYMFDIYYVTVYAKCSVDCLQTSIQEVLDSRTENYRTQPIDLHMFEFTKGTSGIGACIYVIDKYIEKITLKNI